MNRTNRLIILFFLIAGVLGGLIWGISAAVNSRQEHEASLPTPVPTRAPNQDISMLGGGLFAGVHGEYLAENGFDVTSHRVSTFDYATSELLGEADCLAPGSRSGYVYFEQQRPGMIMDELVVFRSFSMLFTRADVYLPYMLESSLVYEADDGTYGITVENVNRVLQAIIDDYSWYDLFTSMGVDISDSEIANNLWLSNQVNIDTSAPEESSGGFNNYFYFASIRSSFYGLSEGEIPSIDTISIEEVPYIRNDFISIWGEQGLQNNHSVYFFYEYIDKSYSWGFANSSESLYVQWWVGLTDEEQEFYSQNSPIVAIYPDVTMSNEHILLALTPACRDLITFIENDSYFAQASWDLLGMRTPLSGLDISNTDVPFIRLDVLAIDEPKFDVFEELGELIGR